MKICGIEIASCMTGNNREANGGRQMKAARKMVVLVDFLDNTEKVVDYAVSIARETSAVPHFLHVVNLFKEDPMLDNPFVDRCEKILISSAQKRMASLVAETSRKELSCTGEVVAGKTLEMISEIANACHSDLIMIGPNGL